MEFLTDFEPLLKTFWYIAIPTSLIFVIQSILTFSGLDASDGINADFDSDFSDTEAPFQLFSFRNLINFLLGFSWSGISFYQYIDSPVLLVIFATMVGASFVGFFFLVIKQLLKLSENNTFTIEKSLFKTGNVYLRVPANRTGTGIVQVSVNGAVREMKALSDSSELATGTLIKVIGYENDMVLVQKL
jgi:hypothetical protein